MVPKEAYLQAVCKYLQCPRNEKERFLAELRKDIECFIAQNPDISYAGIEANFGSPKDLACEFADSLDPHAMERFLCIKKRFFLFTCTLAILMALIYVGFLVADYIEWRRLADGYYVETIIVSPDSKILPELPQKSTDMTLVYR